MIVRRIDKPWGHELLLAHTEWYAAKILYVQAGCRLSLQHHAEKDESLYLLEGVVELELQFASWRMLPLRLAPDRSYRVHPGQRHRLTAITDARVLEVSTPELDDVVRWEDDYGRVEAGREVRLPVFDEEGGDRELVAWEEASKACPERSRGEGPVSTRPPARRAGHRRAHPPRLTALSGE